MLVAHTFSTAFMSASMSGPNCGLVAALFTRMSIRPSAGDAVRDRGFDHRGISGRARGGRDARAERLERGRRLGELVGLARVDAHRRARVGERLADGAADARACRR